MKDHVSGVVVESEVVFGEGGLAGVEGGLVAESVGAVSEGGRHVDDGAGERYVSQESGRGRAQGVLRESSGKARSSVIRREELRFNGKFIFI